MCGHVGFAGEHKEAGKIITFLLILDSTRGTDGTGLFMTSFSKKGECLIKESGDCYNLINNKNYNVVNNNYNLFIGHNRASTRGHNTPSNAHPFNLGRIVGAHNGTLSNFYTLPLYKYYDVDSELALFMIGSEGVEKAVKQFRGSWSFVWYDRKEKTLNFLRNEERPLCYTFDTEGNLYWASEEWMLEATFKKFNIEYSPIVSTTPDSLYTFGFNEHKKPTLISITPDIKGKEETLTTYSKYYHPVVGGIPTSREETKGKKKEILCSCCGDVYSKSDIAYGYHIYVGGIPEERFVCKDCDDLYNRGN